MKKPWMQTTVMGFDPAGAVVDAPPSGGSGVSAPQGGGSPALQPGAGGPSPSPASTPGAQPGSAKTYSEEQVQGMIRDRVAKMNTELDGWKKFGDPKDVSSRLEKAQRLESALNGNDPAQPTAEERELRDLLTKQFPGIDKVSSLESKLAAMEQQAFQRTEAAGREMIGKLAGEKFGVTDPKAFKLIEGAVAGVISQDKEMLAAYFAGDPSVVQKAFDEVFSNFEPLLKSAAGRYSGGKAMDRAQVPPIVPKGGVAAPISSEQKLTGEERRDAAWKRMQELEGGG